MKAFWEKVRQKFWDIIESGIIGDIIWFVVCFGLSLLLYYVSLFYEDATIILVLRVASCVLFIFSIKRFLLILAHNKKMEERIKHFLKGLGDLWQAFQEKLRQMFPDKKGSGLFRIKGYKDEVYRYYDEGGASIKKKRLKWKELKTNAEKVRYLYADFLRKRVKKGFAFRYSDTPVQVRSKLPPEQQSNPVFKHYHEARYFKAADITDDELENIIKNKA